MVYPILEQRNLPAISEQNDNIAHLTRSAPVRRQGRVITVFLILASIRRDWTGKRRCRTYIGEKLKFQ
jgi:hypothetical protein